MLGSASGCGPVASADGRIRPAIAVRLGVMQGFAFEQEPVRTGPHLASVVPVAAAPRAGAARTILGRFVFAQHRAPRLGHVDQLGLGERGQRPLVGGGDEPLQGVEPVIDRLPRQRGHVAHHEANARSARAQVGHGQRSAHARHRPFAGVCTAKARIAVACQVAKARVAVAVSSGLSGLCSDVVDIESISLAFVRWLSHFVALPSNRTQSARRLAEADEGGRTVTTDAAQCLRAARAARTWTQRQLYYHLTQAAQANKDTLPGWDSVKALIGRWENGRALPDSRYANLLCTVYGSSHEELALKVALADDPSFAMQLHDSFGPAIASATELWAEDMNRRQFLQGSSFVVSGFLAPAAQWATSGGSRTVRATGPVRVGGADVATLRDLTTAYRRSDNRSGGGAARDRVVRTLNFEIAHLLQRGRFNEATGRELTKVAAEMTQLAGWMSYDSGMYGLSQRYLVQALGLATAAGDDALAGEVLAAMAHQSAYLGNGGEAVHLARAAAVAGHRSGQRHLVAEAAVLEAQGHARLRDVKAVAVAVACAERELDRADQASGPAYLTYLDEAYMSAKFGHVFRELGDGKRTVAFAEKSLDMKPGYERGHVFNLALLAHGHAQLGNVDQAVHIGSKAASLASTMRSERAVSYVRAVATTLKRYQQDEAVAAFRKRARYLTTA